VDLFESPNASKSFIVAEDPVKNVEGIMALCRGSPVEAVYCVAGGWEGDVITSTDIFTISKNMWKVNMEPALLAAHLAAVLKAPLAVFIGANAALHGTPGMVSYGCAKAALIHLVSSLNDKPSSGFHGRAFVMLPYCVYRIYWGIIGGRMVLDTPANRKAMPNANFSKWTPLNELAAHIYGLRSAPESTSAKIVVSTNDGVTSFKSIA
jgi:dihydropteridine reductase